MSCTRAIGTNSGLIDNFVSGEIGIVDTKGHIEFGAFIAILGSESCSANSIEQISVSPFHTDAPTGRRCESAFALLSHKKVTKRLWPAASYGKIGVVGYRLL